jgi:predicted nuclease of predicted toxin-antitoxin system
VKFLLDANMPRSALALLRQHGHEAEHVRDLGMGADTDASIDDFARRSGLIVVTRDLDFADVRQFPPESRPGLLVLRLADASTASDVVAVLARFLSDTTLVGQIPGHLVILQSDHARFRPPLKP